MKKLFLNSLATARRPQTGGTAAFTLTELLVVMGVVALLAAVLLSASFTTQERVIQAECASNLKQIGSATLVYAAENNDFVPQRSWKDCTTDGNPWQTYEACRISGIGSRVITEGPYGLGPLFFGKEIADPKAFYCPSVQSGDFAYDTYNEAGWPWPSIPPDIATVDPQFDGNPYVRCSYNYYPQPKATGFVNDPTYGPVTLPLLTAQKVTFVSPNPGDPPQSSISEPAPLKTTDLNPTKAVSCDVLQTFAALTHKSGGQPAGVNVLFGDGHVKWVPVRGNNTKGSRQPFDPQLWDTFTGTPVGNNPTAFRIIMNGWMP